MRRPSGLRRVEGHTMPDPVVEQLRRLLAEAQSAAESAGIADPAPPGACPSAGEAPDGLPPGPRIGYRTAEVARMPPPVSENTVRQWGKQGLLGEPIRVHSRLILWPAGPVEA